ncbi:MAG: M81 family metallopeptidase [Ideonella sp.]
MKRILSAVFKHETNTFSPLPTDLRSYAARSLYRGDAIHQYYSDTATEMGAFIDAAQRHGWELVHPVAGDATPSGKVTRDAFETIVGELEAALLEQGPFDALLLCLHGAMVAEHTDDGEGEILRRLRAIVGPHLPIGVTLDLHANVTDEMAALATLLVSYRTYPHIDQYDTGKRCADLLARTLNGEIDPVTTVARGAMLEGVDHGRTTAPGPMREVLARAAEMTAEYPGVLEIGINAGFPWADIEVAGPSAVIVRDRRVEGTPHDELAQLLIKQIWDSRQRETVTPLSVAQGMAALQTALAISGGGPVVMADCADNPGGGGLENSTALLRALIDADVRNVAYAMICDPQTLAACRAAGVGKQLAVRLGGSSQFAGPIEVEAQVRSLQDGKFVFTGPMSRGIGLDIGPTAVLQIGGISVVVSGTRHQVLDPGFFTHAGLQPQEHAVVVVKSTQHFRAAFGPMARQVLAIDSCDGLTSYDFQSFPFRKVRRPAYPLDR